MSTNVHVVTTYNNTTLETETAGGFTDLNEAKIEAQNAAATIALAPDAAEKYSIFIEEWDGAEFVGQRYLRAFTEPEGEDPTALKHEWWFRPASGNPYMEGGVAA